MGNAVFESSIPKSFESVKKRTVGFASLLLVKRAGVESEEGIDPAELKVSG